MAKKREEKPRAAAAGRGTSAKGRGTAAVEWNQVWKTAALVAIFFFMVCLTVPGTIKVTVLLLALVAVAVEVFQHRVLGERLNWLFIAAALWVTWSGISTLYAVSGKFALSEFLKLLAAFCVFLLILAFGRESTEERGRGAALLLETCTALFSFFSIDFLSTRLFSTSFFWLMGLFCSDYEGLSAVETGVRMNSVMGNPNIFAGCVGIGVLLSLGLATTETKTGMRRVHLVCLGINALAFLLAFSMGGSGTIAVAFLAYLLLERKERRASLLILMVETLILALAAAFPIYLTAFGGWDGADPVPLLCMAAMAAVLCLVEERVGRRVSARLAGNEKSVFLLLAAVLAAVAVYGVLAFNLAGPADLEQGETLRRSAYLDAGEYELTLEAGGEVTVVIESQDRQETMMHTSTVLYTGPAQGATFTVPQDSLVVYFNLTASEDLTVDAVTYQGPESGALKLEYKLIPGFVANRLQGLFANQNAIQRVVFFEDGFKLFLQSPVIGLGMGVFENSLFSVQSFYYETKYAHNHYIQTLAETGVIGLVLFVAVLGLAAAAVLLARKGERTSPLTACLGAALVFMIGHAGVEVVFSGNFYLPLALGVLALICLCCGEALPPLPIGRKKTRGRIVGAVPVLLLVYSALLAGNLYAAVLNRQPNYQSLETAAMLDKFEWADYALSYVYSASTSEEAPSTVAASRDAYLQRLEQVRSNTIPYYLAECYFALGRTEDAFRMLDKYTDIMASSQQAWQDAFHLAMTNGGDDPAYLQGVRELYQKLQTWNSSNLGTIVLDQTTQAFLEFVAGQ